MAFLPTNQSGDYDWTDLANRVGGVYAGGLAAQNANRVTDSYGGSNANLDKYQSQLAGMFGQDSPYAQQMRQTLDRNDAKSGRRSQYGTREVELQAALAGKANEVARTGGQLEQVRNQNNQGLVKAQSNEEAIRSARMQRGIGLAGMLPGAYGAGKDVYDRISKNGLGNIFSSSPSPAKGAGGIYNGSTDINSIYNGSGGAVDIYNGSVPSGSEGASGLDGSMGGQFGTTNETTFPDSGSGSDVFGGEGYGYDVPDVGGDFTSNFGAGADVASDASGLADGFGADLFGDGLGAGVDFGGADLGGFADFGGADLGAADLGGLGDLGGADLFADLGVDAFADIGIDAAIEEAFTEAIFEEVAAAAVSSFICMELARQGLVDPEMIADSSTHANDGGIYALVREGYHLIGIPVAIKMKTSPFLTSIIRPLMVARSKQIQHEMGKRESINLGGIAVRVIGEGICAIAGLVGRIFNLKPNYIGWSLVHNG